MCKPLCEVFDPCVHSLFDWLISLGGFFDSSYSFFRFRYIYYICFYHLFVLYIHSVTYFSDNICQHFICRTKNPNELDWIHVWFIGNIVQRCNRKAVLSNVHIYHKRFNPICASFAMYKRSRARHTFFTISVDFVFA